MSTQHFHPCTLLLCPCCFSQWYRHAHLFCDIWLSRFARKVESSRVKLRTQCFFLLVRTSEFLFSAKIFLWKVFGEIEKLEQMLAGLNWDLKSPHGKWNTPWNFGLVVLVETKLRQSGTKQRQFLPPFICRRYSALLLQNVTLPHNCHSNKNSLHLWRIPAWTCVDIAKRLNLHEWCRQLWPKTVKTWRCLSEPQGKEVLLVQVECVCSDLLELSEACSSC